MYINCHTYYSLRYGTLSEEEVLQWAQAAGLQRIALTDINNTSGCLNYISLSAKYGIKPIVGIDFRNGADQQFVALAKNNEGFHEINHFLSQHLHEEKSIPPRAPHFHHAFIIYPFNKKIDVNTLASHEYIGLRMDEIRQLPPSGLLDHSTKLVLLHPATFLTKKQFNTHRILRAIDNNTLLSKLPKTEEAKPTDYYHDPTIRTQACALYPFLIENTNQLLCRCHIYFNFSDDRQSQNQYSYTGDTDEDYKLIEQLCWEGMHYRYGANISDEIMERLDKELRLIREMNFLSYFLINWNIVNYAREQGYFYVGRGSGANSIVAYLLGITDVDPIDLDLYFERFINLFRKNPPDFDVDFSWRDREDVTRYIFDTFPHVSLLATYNCFQYKGALRETGKVFGLPKSEIDFMLSDGFDPRTADQIKKLVLKYASYLQGKPNHLSIHAGGILISEKPITYFSATSIPPKGFPTVQFDMVIAEDVGLYKFDILGQRGLAKIKEALDIIAYNRPELPPIDIHDIPKFKNDAQVAQMISDARCLGCFYVESPAMRMLLQKLRVKTYLELVAASSIIRPGVAKSGMMREYILRHKNPERVKSNAHPVLLKIMPETYGVMVYQEDVIKVAHYFAGLSLGEADVLRRGMSGKYRSRAEFEKVQNKFVENCAIKGYPLEVVKEIWRQIESFAGYAFSKGHSASYAVESYQSIYLKTYFPLEYMVAVMNNGGGFYRVETYIHEARMLGGTIEAPCVNRSFAQHTIDGKTIFLGLGILKSVESKAIKRIISSRERFGAYEDLYDLLERTGISLEQVTILIRVGAFRFTKKSKHYLLWHAHFVLSKKENKPVEQQQLFYSKPKKFILPDFHYTAIEDAYDEMELMGFTLNDPFQLIAPNTHRYIFATDYAGHLHKTVNMLGYLVTVKNTSTANGKRMYFGTFLDQQGHFIDTVHFPPIAAKYPFRGKGIYHIRGKVVEEFGFYSLEVSAIWKVKYQDDPRYGD